MGPLFRGSTQSIFKDKQLLNKLSLNKPLCERVNSSFLCGSAMTFLRTLPPSRDAAAHASDGGRREKLEKHSVRGREQVPHHRAEDVYTAPQHFGVFFLAEGRLVTSQVCHRLGGSILPSPPYPLYTSPVCRNHLHRHWASPPRGLKGFPLRLGGDGAARWEEPSPLLFIAPD